AAQRLTPRPEGQLARTEPLFLQKGNAPEQLRRLIAVDGFALHLEDLREARPSFLLGIDRLETARHPLTQFRPTPEHLEALTRSLVSGLVPERRLEEVSRRGRIIQAVQLDFAAAIKEVRARFRCALGGSGFAGKWQAAHQQLVELRPFLSRHIDAVERAK